MEDNSSNIFGSDDKQKEEIIVDVRSLRPNQIKILPKTTGAREWCLSTLNNHDLCSVAKTKTKNAILTFSSPDRNYLTEAKIAQMEQIAQCWNAELVIINSIEKVLNTEQNKQAATINSFRPNIVNYICKLVSMYNALNQFDRVLWIDDTCVISPFAPNLFDVVPLDSVGALVVPRNCGLSESLSDYKNILKYKNVSIKDEYYNNGVMLVSAQHKELFSFDSIINNQDLFQSPYPTQAWQNYVTYINGCKIFDITCMYNMMPCCLEYDNKNWEADDITHLYPTLLKYYIVHFTGFHRNREKFHKEFFELQQSTFGESITIVIMNFKRPDNIKNFILPYYDTIPAVNQVIVVHCLEDTVFEYKSTKVQHVHAWGTDKEYGVFTRYITAKKYAKDNCILFTDDDVIIPSKTITSLFLKWRENPNRIVGAEGRKLYKNIGTNLFEYKTTTYYGEVDFVLTSCCMSSRDNIKYICTKESLMHDYAMTTTVKWNGEDMFLGLLSASRHSIRCWALDVPISILPNQNYAISSINTHLSERTNFLNILSGNI